MIFYDPDVETPSLPRDPLKALVAPRPIGWISTIDRDGRPNLAPYSFFNLVSERPAIVAFSAHGPKDTPRNVIETGEFVCNLAVYGLRHALNITSTAYAHGISEFAAAGLTPVACVKVKAPRIAEAAAALECVYLESHDLVGRDGRLSSYRLYLGEVVGVHVDERIIVDGRVDPRLAQQIARLGGNYYAVADEASLFTLERPGPR